MGNGTGIGRVRGLGSAKTGTHHWVMQRLTAAANIILLIWLVVSLLRLPLSDYQAVATWASSPWVAVPLLLIVINTFWHFRLGLQVVIEDYQHDESRIVALVLLNFFTIAAGALAIFSILKVAFTGVAH
ncbi:succinate dehydrogenase, hydrophobic membrane anchor protein [Sphingomonas sp. ID0503]|uniref:succinate dehydrogenase, hydrophobic membrane anchor protein n=1 Tax=Sphingomonas sp. ID0503 TaxID=3399691 RepID=UPI003AFA394B